MEKPDIEIVWRVSKRSSAKKVVEELRGASILAIMVGSDCTWVALGRKYWNVGIERKFLYPSGW